MSHKTKAAMQGRQCHYQKLKQSQDTRVNAGGQSLSAPVIAGTAPLARLGGMSKSGHSRQWYTNFSVHLQTTQKLGCLGCTALAHTPFPQIWGEQDQRAGCTAMQHTQSPKISGDTITEIVIVGLGATAVGDTTEKSRSFDRYPDIGYRCNESCIGQNQSYKNSGGQTPEDFQSAFMHSGYQLFGSMPRCCNSLRIIRFIHADTEASPSCARACLIPSSRFGSTRNAICLLPLALISMVDIWLTPDYFEMVIKCMTGAYQKATPRTVRAVPGRLTKTLSEVTTMAELQSTQTRPEFTWRFISASERYPTAKPLVIYVNASSEQEARDTMPGVNLIFAARLPFHAFQLMEVHHA